MGNHDKLGVIRKFLQEGTKAHHIGLIQRRINFVQYRERRRTIAQERKEQGDNRKRSFPTGQRREVLPLFLRQGHEDIHAGVKHIVFIQQFQFRLAAAKETNKDIGKVHLNLRKGLLKLLGHGLVHICQDALQVLLGRGQIPCLLGHKVVAFGKFLVFFQSVGVYRSQFF